METQSHNNRQKAKILEEQGYVMEKFGDLNIRQAGLLQPLFALPGRHGIGDLGTSAYDFIEIIAATGFKIWQILPFNPSSDSNSPYTPYSSFAGDEIYISLELLIKDGLLDSVVNWNEDATRVDYGSIRSFKDAYLKLAYAKFKLSDNDTLKDSYQEFVDTTFWLEGYAKFMALNRYLDREKWPKWPVQYLENCDVDFLDDEVEYHKFVQFVFYYQFNMLKEWAHKHDIAIMGDIPFYVGLDSVDVYFNRKDFMLDQDNQSLFISGASPDYFSDDGQLWGHPLYDWDNMKSNGYKFWMERLSWNNEVFDILRIDHYRAFDTYWKVSADEKTARNGIWVEGPSYDFFDHLYQELPDINIVVEDLGDLRDQVHYLRDHYHLMGMRIIQYGFGEKEEREFYVIPKWCIAYSGTHDNNPLQGWESELPLNEKLRIEDILDSLQYPGDNFNEKVYYRTFACDANIAIVQIQDMLGKGEETRFNLPGTVSDLNWSWKLLDFDELVENVKYTRDIIKKTNR